jgi:hypothetical protein
VALSDAPREEPPETDHASTAGSDSSLSSLSDNEKVEEPMAMAMSTAEVGDDDVPVPVLVAPPWSTRAEHVPMPSSSSASQTAQCAVLPEPIQDDVDLEPASDAAPPKTVVIDIIETPASRREKTAMAKAARRAQLAAENEPAVVVTEAPKTGTGTSMEPETKMKTKSSFEHGDLGVSSSMYR